MALEKGHEMSKEVLLLKEYAVVEMPWDHEKSMSDLCHQFRDEKLEWKEFEDDPPFEALHDWLKEQSRSLFQDDYVQLYEALRFVVQEHVVVKGSATILVVDIDQQNMKLVFFRSLPIS